MNGYFQRTTSDKLKARYGSNSRLGSKSSLNSAGRSGLGSSLAVQMTPRSVAVHSNGMEMQPVGKKEDQRLLIPKTSNGNKVAPMETESPEIVVEVLLTVITLTLIWMVKRVYMVLSQQPKTKVFTYSTVVVSVTYFKLQ